MNRLIAIQIPTNTIGINVTLPFVKAKCSICHQELACVEMKHHEHNAVAYVCPDCIYGFGRAATGKVYPP